METTPIIPIAKGDLPSLAIKMAPSFWAANRNLAKLVIATPLAIAIGFTITCPCKLILSCHYNSFFILLGAAAVAAFLINRV